MSLHFETQLKYNGGKRRKKETSKKEKVPELNKI